MQTSEAVKALTSGSIVETTANAVSRASLIGADINRYLAIRAYIELAAFTLVAIRGAFITGHFVDALSFIQTWIVEARKKTQLTSRSGVVGIA
jgi:hypothetical protein